MSPKASGLTALFMAGCAAATLIAASAAHAQTLSIGGLTFPVRVRPAATAQSGSGGNPSYGPTRAEMANRDAVSPAAKKLADNAETAERIVHYGLDNELPDRSDVKMAQLMMREVNACIDGASELRRSEPNATLFLNGYDGMSIDQVESQFCKPALALLEPVAAAAVRNYEARWAGLAAERLQVVEMHGLTAYTVYGHGKRALSTPAQLQGSDVWYVWDEEKGYLMPHWWMAAIRWKGNSYTKTVQKGAGSAPPASLFR